MLHIKDWICSPFQLLNNLDGEIIIWSGKLGYNVGLYPKQFILFTLLTSLIFCLGLGDMKYETDLEYLFVPVGAPSFNERKVVEDHFPNDYQSYQLGHDTRSPNIVQVILMPINNTGVLNKEFFLKVKAIDRVFNNLTVTLTNHKNIGSKLEPINLTYHGLCAKRSQECVGNEFLEVLDGSLNLTYPTTKDPFSGKSYALPNALGGIVLHKDMLTIKNASALRLTYILDPAIEGSAIWEQTALDLALKLKVEGTKILPVSSKSIEQELVSNIHRGLDHIEYMIPLLLVYCLTSSSTNHSNLKSTDLITCFGIVNTLLATASAWGLLCLMGVPWQAINLASLYLLAGVGMDDTFILLSAWKRTDKNLSIEERMKTCYQESMASITISSMTNVASFAVGAFTPGFNSIRIFCAYSGIGIIMIYLWTLTMFGGILALCGHTEELLQKRNCCTDIHDSNIVTKDNKFAKILTSKLGKAFVSILCFVYWGASGYGIMHMRQGLERKNLALKDSYSGAFYNEEDRLFRMNPYRFQIVLEGEMNYSDPENRLKVNKMLQEIKNCEFIMDNELFSENWMDMFDRYLEGKSRLSGPVIFNDEASYVQEVAKLIDGPIPIRSYVNFNANFTSILATRYFLQSTPIHNAMDEMYMILKLRAIAEDHNATIFHPYNLYWDQFLQVSGTAQRLVGFSSIIVFLITFLLLPRSHRIMTSFCVAVVVLSIEFGVCGTMYFADIRLDVVSVICLTICIGFSVDFSAHIAYHYLATASDPLKSERSLQTCLEAIGKPVIQAAISTIICVSFLLLIPSYILRSFATMLILVIVYGTFHGLIVLPVVLDMFFGKQKSLVSSRFNSTFKIKPSDIIASNPAEDTLVLRGTFKSFDSDLDNITLYDFRMKDINDTHFDAFSKSHSTPKAVPRPRPERLL